jgi:hypothetical protein
VVIPNSEVIIVCTDTPHPVVTWSIPPRGERDESPPWNERINVIPTPPPQGSDSDKENVPPNKSSSRMPLSPKGSFSDKSNTLGKNRRPDL